MQITVIRFGEAVQLGRSMEPVSSISHEQRFEGGVVNISLYDDHFVKLAYVFPDSSKDYSQLIPLVRIDTCLYKEEDFKSVPAKSRK